jgi:hypothetical protein
MELSQPCPIKGQYLKKESAFHPLLAAAILFACWKCLDYRVVVVLPPPHTTYDNGISEIFSSFTRIRCLQETIPQQN